MTECADDDATGVDQEADFLIAVFVANQVFIPSLGSDSDKLVRRLWTKFFSEDIGLRLLFADERSQSRTQLRSIGILRDHDLQELFALGIRALCAYSGIQSALHALCRRCIDARSGDMRPILVEIHGRGATLRIHDEVQVRFDRLCKETGIAAREDRNELLSGELRG